MNEVSNSLFNHINKVFNLLLKSTINILNIFISFPLRVEHSLGGIYQETHRFGLPSGYYYFPIGSLNS
jgi:hypothetical protein